MSEVITDKLTGKTAAGNVTITSEGGSATMQLQQGVAKAWNKTNAAGTSIDDSFNISSLSDTATGTQGHNFTSSFSTAGNVAVMATSNEQSSTILFTRDSAYARTTSQITVASYAWSTPAYTDVEQGVGFLGDLV